MSHNDGFQVHVLPDYSQCRSQVKTPSSKFGQARESLESRMLLTVTNMGAISGTVSTT